jgi:hypothetical protein
MMWRFLKDMWLAYRECSFASAYTNCLPNLPFVNYVSTLRHIREVRRTKKLNPMTEFFHLRSKDFPEAEHVWDAEEYNFDSTSN